MATNIRIASAFIIAFVVETLFYGVFLTLFASSTYLQWQRRRQRRTVNRVLFYGSVYFFLGITGYWILDFYRTLDAVLGTPGGPALDLYFANIAASSSVARIAMYESQIFVGDFIIVYRLYHVYQQNIWICVLPIITSIALVITGSALAWMAARLVFTAGGIFQLNQWSTVCFTLTLFNNLYCCFLIVLKLYRSQRKVSRLVESDSPVSRLIRIFIESSALWALVVILTFVSSLAGSNLEYSFSQITVPIIGISFCLVIVRMSNSGESTVVSAASAPNPSSGHSYPPQNVAISVERTSMDNHVDMENGSLAEIKSHQLSEY